MQTNVILSVIKSIQNPHHIIFLSIGHCAKHLVYQIAFKRAKLQLSTLKMFKISLYKHTFVEQLNIHKLTEYALVCSIMGLTLNILYDSSCFSLYFYWSAAEVLFNMTNLQIYAIWSYWIYQSHIDLFEDLSLYISMIQPNCKYRLLL